MRWLLGLALGVGLTFAFGSARASADSSYQYVSGYTCDPAHGQPYCGATASGVQVGPGAAACPPGLPFGTPIVVHFPAELGGDAAFVCWDRGPVDHWDLFWPTIADCFAHTGVYPVDVG